MLESILLKIVPYTRYLKVLGVVLVFLAGCYVTHMYYSNKLKDAIIATRKAELELANRVNKVEVQYVTKVVYIKVKGEERKVEIPVYIPTITYVDRPVDGKCVDPNLLNTGFVEVHNAAVESRSLTLMTTDEISTQTPITMQRLGDVINSNYTQCNTYIVQVEKLQAVLREIERKTK